MISQNGIVFTRAAARISGEDQRRGHLPPQKLILN
jgi:hypothetical protein